MSTASQQRKPSKTTRTEWVERWCPPKPLVGLQPIEKVLNRHTEVSCPESRLVVAVIARAIHDCLCLTNRRQRREARRFILGPNLEGWCDLIGMQPHFVRLVAQKAGYLAPEDHYLQRLPIKVPALPDPVVTGSSTPIHTITAHRTGGPVHA
ncbi:hypothetical protein [Rhodoferax sp.]|uniref:hypothetical protein n=1 Tax=Rhodoferax sp. TaxID=50421 RepID=UPI003BB745D8